MKHLILILKLAIQTGLSQWRAAASVYVVQLLLALTIGMQVYEVLHASIGNSLEINKLLYQYDHTVITDFLKAHGSSLTPLIGQIRWLVLIWLLFAVFLDGGLIYVAIRPGRHTWADFWKGAAVFFRPFLVLGAVFLILLGVWTAIVLGPAFAFLQPSLEVLPDERYSIVIFMVAMVVWIWGTCVLLILSVLSRTAYFRHPSLRASLKQAWEKWRKQKGRYLSLLAFIGMLIIILTVAYWSVVSLTEMASAGAILLVFLLQQTYMFTRMLLRITLYAGIDQLDQGVKEASQSLSGATIES